MKKKNLIVILIMLIVIFVISIIGYFILNGIYYSDIQSVVDSEGEEWGYDAELADGTPVIITFDSQNTDSRYDDVITGLTEIKG